MATKLHSLCWPFLQTFHCICCPISHLSTEKSYAYTSSCTRSVQQLTTKGMLHLSLSHCMYFTPDCFLKAWRDVTRHKVSGCMTDRQHIPTKTTPQPVVTWPTSGSLGSIVTSSWMWSQHWVPTKKVVHLCQPDHLSHCLLTSLRTGWLVCLCPQEILMFTYNCASVSSCNQYTAVLYSSIILFEH